MLILIFKHRQRSRYYKGLWVLLPCFISGGLAWFHGCVYWTYSKHVFALRKEEFLTVRFFLFPAGDIDEDRLITEEKKDTSCAPTVKTKRTEGISIKLNV